MTGVLIERTHEDAGTGGVPVRAWGEASRLPTTETGPGREQLCRCRDCGLPASDCGRMNSCPEPGRVQGFQSPGGSAGRVPEGTPERPLHYMGAWVLTLKAGGARGPQGPLPTRRSWEAVLSWRPWQSRLARESRGARLALLAWHPWHALASCGRGDETVKPGPHGSPQGTAPPQCCCRGTSRPTPQRQPRSAWARTLG